MVFKIILKIPTALRRDNEMQRTKTTAGSVYVPRKPRTQRQWKPRIQRKWEMSKITKKRRIVIPEATLREKIDQIKYSRDYSFLFSTADEPVVVPIKDLKEASKSNGDTSSQMKLKETLLDAIDGIPDRRVDDEGFQRRIEEDRRSRMVRSCITRRPKISSGGPRLLIK